MRFVTMSDIRREMKSKHPRRHNAIEMNVGQPNRRNTETDEVSVIARGRACVRTVQYRHSEVMKSFGRSHIQRCVRAAAAQAMYDPCYYEPPISTLTPDRRRPSARALPRLAGQMQLRQDERTRSVTAWRQDRNVGTGGRRTSQGIAYTDTAHEQSLLGSTRGRGHKRAVAYRGANGPSLLTKQAQHSTDQYYPQCSHCLVIAVV